MITCGADDSRAMTQCKDRSSALTPSSTCIFIKCSSSGRQIHKSAPGRLQIDADRGDDPLIHLRWRCLVDVNFVAAAKLNN